MTESTDPRALRSRAAVVQGAVELLMADGPAAVTVDAVVQRTGVARSTIYRHFPTSTDVLRAAVDAALPQVWPSPATLRAGEPAPTRAEVRGDLVAGVRALADQLSGGAWGRALPALLELVARDPALAAHRDAIVARHRAPLVATLRRARDAGLLLPGAGGDPADDPADDDFAEVGARLVGPLFYRRLVTGQPLTHALCDRLVDSVLVPAATSGEPQ